MTHLDLRCKDTVEDEHSRNGGAAAAVSSLDVMTSAMNYKRKLQTTHKWDTRRSCLPRCTRAEQLCARSAHRIECIYLSQGGCEQLTEHLYDTSPLACTFYSLGDRSSRDGKANGIARGNLLAFIVHKVSVRLEWRKYLSITRIR